MNKGDEESDSIASSLCVVSDLLDTARTALAQGNWHAALASFRAASQHCPQDATLRRHIGSMLRDAGRLDDAELEFRESLRLEPDNPAGLVGLAEIARFSGDTEAAIIHYQSAAAVNPNDLAIHSSLRSLLIEQSRFDWKADVTKSLGILLRQDSTAPQRLAACNLLAQYGLTRGLEPHLQALAQQFPQAADLLQVARQLGRSGLARSLPGVNEVAGLEHNDLILSFGVTERPVPGSDTLVMVFGGANHRLGLAFDIIQRIIRPAGISTLYLRDLERTWYLGGIVGLGRSFDETAEGLRRTVDRLGASRVLAIGNCVGCAGALRYGLAIGIESILAISPRLRIPDSSPIDPGMRDKLSRLRDSVPLCAADIGDLYESADRRPRLNFVYGKGCREDAEDALRMAGVAGVTTASIDGYSGHACLNILLGRGLLSPLLHDFIRDGNISPELRASIALAAG